MKCTTWRLNGSTAHGSSQAEREWIATMREVWCRPYIITRTAHTEALILRGVGCDVDPGQFSGSPAARFSGPAAARRPPASPADLAALVPVAARPLVYAVESFLSPGPGRAAAFQRPLNASHPSGFYGVLVRRWRMY